MGNSYPYLITESTENDGKYEWTISPPPSDSPTCRVKAIGMDASNNQLAEDESDADFIIDTSAPPTPTNPHWVDGQVSSDTTIIAPESILKVA